MAFICIALILEPLEMVLQSYQYLEPWLYLSFQVYKALLSTGFLIFEVYAYVKRGQYAEGIWKWVRIILTINVVAMTYHKSPPGLH